MSSALPVIPTARSMLEEMLAALKLRDDKPKDEPPALPTRPALKRRPPSSKMPTKFKVEGAEPEAESESKKASEAGDELKELNNGFSEETDGLKTGNHFEEGSDVHGETPVSQTVDERELNNGFSEETDGLKTGNHFEEGSDVHGETPVSQTVDERDSMKDDPDPRLAQFEKLISNINDELKRKEEENAALLQQLQQFEKQWAMCQEQMKCMEDVYLQQIEALKTNLASAHMTLAAIEAAASQHEKSESEAAVTPPPAQAQTKPHASFPEVPPDDGNNPVQHLTKEFEKQKQVFDDDARGLDEAKPSAKTGQSVASSIEELGELKARYISWKKEYEARLRHTKKVLLKVVKSECEKQHDKWWFSRRKRSNKTAPHSTKVGYCHCMNP